MKLRYSNGMEEVVETRGRNSKTAIKAIELAHKSRHWSHGVMSIDGQRGVAAEQVYSSISQASITTNPPHGLAIPQETIFEALRKLCKEPLSVANMRRRGNERRLQSAVNAIVWKDGDAPIVEPASQMVRTWSSIGNY